MDNKYNHNKLFNATGILIFLMIFVVILSAIVIYVFSNKNLGKAASIIVLVSFIEIIIFLIAIIKIGSQGEKKYVQYLKENFKEQRFKIADIFWWEEKNPSDGNGWIMKIYILQNIENGKLLAFSDTSVKNIKYANERKLEGNGSYWCECEEKMPFERDGYIIRWGSYNLVSSKNYKQLKDKKSCYELYNMNSQYDDSILDQVVKGKGRAFFD